MSFIPIHNPETGGQAQVSDDEWTLSHYAELGWRPVTASDNAGAPTVQLERDGTRVDVPEDQAAGWIADGWTETTDTSEES